MTTPDLAQVKQRQQQTWAAADYSATGDASEECGVWQQCDSLLRWK